MAIVTDRIVIGRCMKCASQWLGEVMKAVDQTCTTYSHNPQLDKVDLPDRLNVFFVRHPLSWYPSYWAYRERTGWAEGSAAVSGRELDMHRAPTFDGFIENILSSYPYLTYLYDFQMGGVNPLVGRVENLKQDLASALTKAGQEFIHEALDIPAINKSSNLPVWNNSLAIKVLEFEKEVVGRWYS